MNIERGEQAPQDMIDQIEPELPHYPGYLQKWGRSLIEIARQSQNKEWLADKSDISQPNTNKLIDFVYHPLPTTITIAIDDGCTKEQYFRLLEAQEAAAQRWEQAGIQPLFPHVGDRFDTATMKTRSDKDLIVHYAKPQDYQEVYQGKHNTVHSLVYPGLMDTQAKQPILKAVVRRRLVELEKQ